MTDEQRLARLKADLKRAEESIKNDVPLTENELAELEKIIHGE